MSASRSWLLGLAVLVGCSSSESAAPVPEGTPGIDPSLSSKRPTVLSGGQSGTDSGGAYNCDGQGAPPLASLPLDQTPDGYACSPAAVLAVIAGTRTFECIVYRATLDAPATDTTPPNYIYSQEPGPNLMLQLQPGGAAHLLDAVLTGEDGSKGSCTLLGIDVSASITGADGGVAVTAERAVVDRFCSGADLRAKTHLRVFGGEEDASLILAFDARTGQVVRLEFDAQTYALVCREPVAAEPSDLGTPAGVSTPDAGAEPSVADAG